MNLLQRNHLTNDITWVAIAALTAGFVALVCSWLLFLDSPDDWWVMTPSASLAAAGTTAWLWRWFLTRGKPVTIKRGIGVGVLASVLAHPLTWFLVIVLLYLEGETGSLGEPVINPLQGVPVALLYSLFSLLLVGWLTALLGAAGGGILAYLQARFQSDLTI